jgi:hypothetical protein
MSVTTYFRIELPLEAALERLTDWQGRDSYEAPAESDGKEEWQTMRGALYVHHQDGWTVFDDVTGYFNFVPTESWLQFARGAGLFMAHYNSATFSAELLVIQEGKVIREVRSDQDGPNSDWVEIAGIVDDDPYYYGATRRWLLRRRLRE